jgi:hypothetical protein
MVALQGFPMVNQLTTVTGDGQPSENAQFDCVAASIDAACRYLLNQPETSVFNPDHFKDVAAGQSYTGGTSASEYIAFCKSLGVQLWKFAGMPAILVNEAHKQLDAGHPVIFTEPDPYVSASLGWTHVCVFFAEGPGYLVALDPYIARPIRRTDQEWSNILLNNEIWVAELEEDFVKPLSINDPAVSALFVEHDADHWQSKRTGCILHDGLLADYIANGENSLKYLGDVIHNEIPGAHGDSVQYYQFGVRMWVGATGKVVSVDLTNPPGSNLPRLLSPQQVESPQEHAVIAQIKELVSKF